MREPESIEILLAKELRSLCPNCAAFDTCAYRKSSTKIIIQCNLYELAEEEQASHRQEANKLKGLCITCSQADTCRLPDRKFGVWRCEEYE